MNEWQEQCIIFRWAEMQEAQYPELKLLKADLNGVRLTIGQAMKAKRAGMKKGYPDMFLPIQRNGYAGLFIELKVGKNQPTKEQKKWLTELGKQGYKTCCCWGAEAAITAIKQYMGWQLSDKKGK